MNVHFSYISLQRTTQATFHSAANINSKYEWTWRIICTYSDSRNMMARHNSHTSTCSHLTIPYIKYIMSMISNWIPWNCNDHLLLRKIRFLVSCGYIMVIRPIGWCKQEGYRWAARHTCQLLEYQCHLTFHMQVLTPNKQPVKVCAVIIKRKIVSRSNYGVLPMVQSPWSCW